MNLKIPPVTRPTGLQGRPVIPGDKSVSHRALMFGALARGTTEISHLLESGDVHSTWRCLEAMGARIRRAGNQVVVEGGGMRGLRPPSDVLDCGNSGTTIRLLMGILSGQEFECSLTGDESLRRRPMKRIAGPLRRMGAEIELTRDEVAPIRMRGTRALRGIEYELPVASAQLKSALLLAGLFASGTTRLTGLIQSRDHTERLLPHFGVPVDVGRNHVAITGGAELRAAPVTVPGDLSSAAFWIAAATLVPGSGIEIRNVSLNPTRIGILKALERMGARIERELTCQAPEPIGILRISSAALQATVIAPEEVPELIDEIPMIAVLATQASGTTVIRGAEELRVKESDRIEAVAANLRRMGVELETFPDGLAIRGGQKLRGARIESLEDHRIAMAFSIAALIAEGETEIVGTECVGISYPTFYDTLAELRG